MTSKLNKDTFESYEQNVGEVVTFVGLKGIMKVRPSSNNPTLFLDISNIFVKPKLQDSNGKTLPCVNATIKEIKIVKNFFQIRLNEFDTRTSVENFRGAILYTNKAELRDLAEDQWWVKDLIGLEVYGTKGQLIGTVCDAPGENGEFLEIQKAGSKSNETVIVSFVKELFPTVDIKARRVEAIDLPGLFD